MASLSEDERRQLRNLGFGGAKEQIKMSRETFQELTDQNGVATPATVMRIRHKLAALRGEAPVGSQGSEPALDRAIFGGNDAEDEP